MPSDYLPGHVHFIHGALDGPGDGGMAAAWLRMTGKEDMVMFGSSHPHWHTSDPYTLPAGWTDEQRDKVLYRNAARLYGLEVAAQPA